ncbi:MAG: HAD-IIA family hydrolase [Clostridia bacterium]
MIKLNEIELFLFDMDGTVYIGENEIAGSFDAIRELKKQGKRICFFTNNSSKSAKDYILKLKKMNLTIDDDEIYTSGEVTCEYINKNFAGKSVFVLGNEKLQNEFIKHHINLSENNPDICVLGFDTSLEYGRLYRFCAELFKGKPYIATHPDMFCPADGCPMPDIGGMILLIDATINRKPDIIIGKPYTASGEGVKNRFNLSADKIAMVGDRLYTDIQFGINNGFTSVLVLSGETTLASINESEIKPDYVFNTVADMVKML